MKYAIVILTLMMTISSCSESRSKTEAQIPQAQSELQIVQKWFDSWELVSTEILHLEAQEPPLMIFFDASYVYSNSNIGITDGQRIKGPEFFGKELVWYEGKHNDTITLPTGENIPVGLMSFAGSYKGEFKNLPFFVMSTVEIWKLNSIRSAQLGDENLYTSVFLHEFAHSQQADNFGKKLDDFENSYDLDASLTDDMIQFIYKNDTSYVKVIEKEIEVFYNAYLTPNIQDAIALAKEGIIYYNHRQEKFFQNELTVYKQLDDFFLTMEGIGQYVSFVWLTHPSGGGIDKITALEGIRRDKSWWSQDEGLALFLLYTRITTPDLKNEMFADETQSIIHLLSREVENLIVN